MDSFFAKKGLTLSRNTASNSNHCRQLLLRSQEQNVRPIIHPPNNPIHSIHKHADILPTQNNQNNNRQDKSSTIGPAMRQIGHQTQAHPIAKPPQTRFVGFSPSKQQQSALNLSIGNELSRLSTADNKNCSFQTTLTMLERQSVSDRTDTYSKANPSNKLKMVLESHRSQAEYAKINKVGYLQSPSLRDRQQSHRISTHPQNYAQGMLEERVGVLQQQKQSLPAELRKRDGKAIPQEWFQEKYALLKEINQKTAAIRDLEDKVGSLHREINSKVSSLQFQVRMLEGGRSRLQNENQANRRQWVAEREKNEKAKEEMHRLIFFEDDLIHAKDYSRLKEELQNVLTENALMFQEHQKYILSVSESRRTLANRLEEVEDELFALKKELAVHKAKAQTFTDYAEDKMQLIKLQNQLNFLRKKGEEWTKALIAKERQLEQAKIAMKELITEHNQRSQAGQKYLQEVNLQQIKQTIASYQDRIEDMAQALSQKTEEVNRLRLQLQNLTNQVRSSREERQISTMKQKSSEKRLKNEIQTLQRALQGEQGMGAKRTANLEQSLQRKVRQIGEKDRFIKNFLLTRAKQLERGDLQSIGALIKEYFSGEQGV